MKTYPSAHLESTCHKEELYDYKLDMLWEKIFYDEKRMNSWVASSSSLTEGSEMEKVGWISSGC